MDYDDLILSLLADRLDFLLTHRRETVGHIVELLLSRPSGTVRLREGTVAAQHGTATQMFQQVATQTAAAEDSLAALNRLTAEASSRAAGIRIVRGAVPDSFAEAVPETIAFLHLDMNSSVAEIAALEALFDRVSPGGLIVFDDYGWIGYEAQQYAEERFMKKRGHHILELPTGQGLVIKH
jgi:Macrocin-O-methyltransferase (TylF)